MVCSAWRSQLQPWQQDMAACCPDRVPSLSWAARPSKDQTPGDGGGLLKWWQAGAADTTQHIATKGQLSALSHVWCFGAQHVADQHFQLVQAGGMLLHTAQCRGQQDRYAVHLSWQSPMCHAEPWCVLQAARDGHRQQDRQAVCDALGLVQWNHCAYLAGGGGLSGGGGLGGGGGLQARLSDLDPYQVKQ